MDNLLRPPAGDRDALDALKQVIEELIPFNKFLGVRVARIEVGKVRIEVPWRDEFIGDPMKPAMHGGVMSALADAAGGFAVWSALVHPMSRVSTIDLRIDYLRPGRLERLCAEAEVVRVGGRVGVSDIRLFHPGAEKDTVATGKGVYAIRTPKAKSDGG